MNTKEEEWGNVLCLRDSVVLRDRLMTDAALGGPRPIKSEHSYSLLAPSPPPSPATPGANPHTPNSDSSSGAIGSVANTNSSMDFANLDHKSLDIRSRIDGNTLLQTFYSYTLRTCDISCQFFPKTISSILFKRIYKLQKYIIEVLYQFLRY